MPGAVVRDGSSLAATFLPRMISALTGTRALVVLWLMVIAYAVRFALFKLPAPPEFTDFNHYYTATLALREGSNPYVTSFAALGHSLGLELSGLDIENQPPTFFLFFGPLTRLGPHSAYWVWVSISLASLIIAVYLLLTGETSLDAREALLFAAFLFLYPAVYEHFVFANMQIVIALLIVIAMHCMRKGADVSAGFALALATALKAYPAFLAIFLICRRRWRSLLWMTTWSGVIGLLTLWRVGLDSFSFVNTFALTTARDALQNPGFLSIDCVVSHLFWHGNMPLTPIMDTLRRAMIAVVWLAVFTLTVSATTGAGPDRGWRALSLWITAMILLSPIGEPHYLVLLMVPFASIADAAARGEAEPRVIYGAFASYLVTFSRYPLTLLHRLGVSSVAFFWVANQFWFFALGLAYLAAYWLLKSPRNFVQNSVFLTPAAAAEAKMH